MTTHVFIVDAQTFPIHLKYKFAGTGARNADEHSELLADIKRVRPGDKVIFYLMGVGFYGIFRISQNSKIINEPDYLLKDLGKKLIYRVFIDYDEVYPNFLTEWEALDELPVYAQDVIWSLIYRKLKAWRGCTPITIDENARLVKMLKEKNSKNAPLNYANKILDWDPDTQKIIVSENSQVIYNPTKTSEAIILKNEIQKRAKKEPNFLEICKLIKRDFNFPKNSKYESFLQMYFTENIGLASELDQIAGTAKDLIWIGNEVACGFGMQKIDILTVLSDVRKNREYRIVELKVVPIYLEVTNQLERYVNWTRSYIKGAINSNIQPIVVATKFPENREQSEYWKQVKEALNKFNTKCIAKPIKYFEFTVEDQGLSFLEIQY